MNSYSYGRNNPITSKDPDGRFIPQAIILGGLYGGLGGAILQGYSDYQSRDLSGLGVYASAFGKGAAVGVATVINPFLGAGTASSLSLRESYRNNGGYITTEDFIYAGVEGAVTGLTAGFLKGLPGITGPQASKIFGGNYFSGAHGVRYAQEAAFGLGTDIYYKNIQQITQSLLNFYAPKTTTRAPSGGGNISQLSKSVIDYANTPGADLSDPGFIAGIRAINEYNNSFFEPKK